MSFCNQKCHDIIKFCDLHFKTEFYLKITEEEIVDRQSSLTIELEEEDLGPYLDRGYRKVVQRTRIPGFRKGKAPRSIIESYVGREGLLNEVLDTMLPEVTGLAIEKQSLDASGLPRIELLDLSPLTFKATIPLTPLIEMGPYREIRIEEEIKEISDDDVTNRLRQLQDTRASWAPVDRAVKFQDMITAEVLGEVEGQKIIDEGNAVFIVDEKSTNPFPGFSQLLEGIMKDEEKGFDLSIAEDHPSTELQGKTCTFNVKVTEIKEKTLPELDDEFAKEIGETYANLEELSESIKKELEVESTKETDQQYKETILSALLEQAKIDLPPLLVEHEIDHLTGERNRVLERANIRLDDYLTSIGKSNDEMLEELKMEAMSRLNRTYIIGKLAELEGLDVTEEEVNEKMEEIVPKDEGKATGLQDIERIKNSVLRMLLVEKTMDRLASIGKGEDIPPIQVKKTIVDDLDTSDDKNNEEGDADDGKS